MTGWARKLDLEQREDPAGVEVLEQVRRAIEVERRQTAAAGEIVISQAVPVGDDGCFWRLRIQASRADRRRLDWEYATVRQDPIQVGNAFEGQVLEASQSGGAVLVESAPGEEPVPGRATVWPYDFLAAARSVATSPELQPLRTLWVPLLRAALGQAGGHRALPDRPLEAWRWNWAFVWGPPGTGKTQTIATQVGALLNDPDERVLVVSPTNLATDQVALRIAKSNPDQAQRLQRLGSAVASRFKQEGLLQCLPGEPALYDEFLRLEQIVDSSPSPYDRLRARSQLRNLRGSLPTLSSTLLDDDPRSVVTTLHAAVRAAVSDDHRTLVERGRAPFTTVVIDEGGLVARSTAALVGLLAARQVVIVGDPKQLSPICVATRAMHPQVKRWLAESAMAGIGHEQPNVQSLTEQYRMHPHIRAAVSELSYEGRLSDAPPVVDRPWQAGGAWADGPRALWVDLSACGLSPADQAASRDGARGSWTREGSLKVLRRILAADETLRNAPGAFVTPYRSQVAAARQVLDDLGATQWTASSVHALQGSERGVVVFDVVRSGSWERREWTRLINVACSRAQELLLCLAGDGEMSAGPLRQMKAHLRRCGLTGTDRLEPIEEQALLLTQAAAEPDPPTAAVPRGDPASLSVQICWQRASRSEMTRHQAQLVARRSLKDLGPRVVRGVAGSGKTIVLARWACAELSTHRERRATVLYSNAALRPHLEHLLERSWDHVTGGAPYPHDRVDLLHVHELLRSLRSELALPPTADAHRYDYEVRAGELLAAGPVPARFDLLYIDEAQDLGPNGLRLAIDLVKPVDGARPVRIFYDNAQNIYGRTTPTWSEFGLQATGRSTVLREAFRSTRQSMELALNLLHQLTPLERDRDLMELRRDDYLRRDETGWWDPAFCVVNGMPPQIALFDERALEIEHATSQIIAWSQEPDFQLRWVRVLVPNKELGEAVAAAIRDRGVYARYATSYHLDPGRPDVLVTTPHSYKGYDAEIAMVVGLDAFVRHGQPLASLLYVALTRAKTLLCVSACQHSRSEAGQRIVQALLVCQARLRGETA